MVSRKELVERAEALGHKALRVQPTKSGRRVSIECGCGWGAFVSDGHGGMQPTVTVASVEQAINRMQHHLWKALDDDYQRRKKAGLTGESRPMVRGL